MTPLFTGMIGWLTTFCLIGLVIYKCFLRRDWPLLSYHTFFIIGFMQFYSVPMGLYWLLDIPPTIGRYTPTLDEWNACAALVPIFIIIYLLCYSFGRRRQTWTKYIPGAGIPTTQSGVFITIGVTLVTVVALAVLGGLGSLVEVFLVMIRPAMCAFAAALTIMLVIRQPGNPLYWGIFLATFAFGLVISTTFGIGRRDAVSMFLAIAWMGYWAHLRYRSGGRQLAVLTGLLVVAGFFILSYSAIRSKDYTREGTGIATRAQQLGQIATGGGGGGGSLLDAQSLSMIFVQDTPLNTSYIMHSFPRDHALFPFNGIAYFVTNPIPRALWEGKPLGIGTEMQKILGTGGNLGVGIIGHGWIEFMFPGVVLYAAVFGLLYAVLDNSMIQRANNPYFIAAMGASLGQIIAVPRGEVSLFMVLWFYGLIGILFMLYCTRLAFDAVMKASLPLQFGTEDPANMAADPVLAPSYVDYGEYGDYSEDQHDDEGRGEPNVSAPTH